MDEKILQALTQLDQMMKKIEESDAFINEINDHLPDIDELVQRTMQLKDPLMEEIEEFAFIYKGYRCVVLLNKNIGTLCGYVILSPGHRFHGKDYDNIPVNVHGGLTFAAGPLAWPWSSDKAWVIGFDCAHYKDLIPSSFISTADIKRAKILNITYKDALFVVKELKQLVDQLLVDPT